MENPRKLFLLDAYALIYRAYYAFIKSPRMNSKGQNTSAVFGFVNTLEDLLKRENPTHIAVAFDPSGPTFRHEAYEAYKAQREKTPEVISWSVPWIKKIIEAYRIPILEVAGFEADDVIGTISRKAEKAGFTVYMMTPDKDYGQLVTDKVFMYKPKHGSNDFDIMGPEQVKNKYGLTNTSQMIDYLGLVGDSSDNIPGCPGVGDISARKLLAEFGSIDNLLLNTNQLKGALKDKINNNSETIKFSRFLATIRMDVPIELKEESLVRETINEESLHEIFEELEFRNLWQRVMENNTSSKIITQPVPSKAFASKKPNTSNGQFSIWDTMEESTSSSSSNETDKKNTRPLSDSKETLHSSNPLQNEAKPYEGTDEKKYSILKGLKDVDHKYYLIDNQLLLDDFLAKISSEKSFCIDTETTGLDAMTAELVGMSFSWEKNEAYYLPFTENFEKSCEKLLLLKNILENPETEKIGQNLKYDMVVLAKYGIKVKGPIFDTMIAHYLLQPELRHNMDYLAEIYLNYQTIHIDELIGLKGKNQKNMRDLPPAEVYEYAAEDADITRQLKTILEKEIRESNLEYLCYEVEMPLVKVLAKMEITGVGLDKSALKESSDTLTTNLLQLEKNIQDLAGEPFNINSPKQIGEILFEKLKIVGKPKKTKTGQYSTSEDVLESLKGKHPIVEKILEQRGLKKLLSTYIDALPELINIKTGKIHTSYNQAVTSTGRLSSSNPNLQNIPVREALGKEIRKAFTAEKGCLFFSADYSQIELRIMAHLSKDPSMIEAFQSGQDIHAATAAKIYKIPLEEVTSDMRRKAKTANFGIIYGISVFGLAERMGVPRNEAKELIDGYFETYPQVKAYMDTSIKKARENGWVETLYHRKRYLPDILSQNGNVRGYAERNAINAPIQGTAADIIKLAMVNIQNALERRGLNTKMILQVHDELNFIVPENELSEVSTLVSSEMENAVKLDVPLMADTGYGQNWLEAHS
jgi:DNA polymerase I